MVPPPRGRPPKRYKSHNSTLPSALKERLGQDGPSTGPKYSRGKGKGHGGRTSILNRKEQRKQARIAVKQNRVVHQQRQRKALEAASLEQQREAIKARWKAEAEAKREKQGDTGGKDDNNEGKKKDTSKPKESKKKDKADKKKKRKRSLTLDEEEEGSAGEYQGPPGPIDPEDELIAMYERKLGRVTKADGLGDGLDDIVSGLPSLSAHQTSTHPRPKGSSRRRRKQAGSDSDSDPFAAADDDDDSGRSSGRLSGRSDSTSVHSDDDDEERSASSGSDMSDSSSASGNDQDKPSQAQSLYGKSFGKPADGKTAYVPPALRKKQEAGGGGGGDVVRITRVLQGHINRMALSNIERTIKAVLDLYDNHSRNDVGQALSDVLVKMALTPSATGLSNFMILGATVIAGIHTCAGVECSAPFVEVLVKKLHSSYQQGEKKSAENLMIFLSHLYNFHVISCSLMYDFVRVLVKDFTPNAVQLLLTLLVQCGFQLRGDDPAALRDIIIEVKQRAKQEVPDLGDAAGEDGGSTHATNDGQSSHLRPPQEKSGTNAPNASGDDDLDAFPARVRYMLTTIYDLKNNRRRHRDVQSSERLQGYKQALKSLERAHGAQLGVSELRVTLEEILKSDEKGRWWLVGAAWRGKQVGAGSSDNTGDDGDGNGGGSSGGGGNNASVNVITNAGGDQYDQKILALAKKHRMNTPVRKAVFCTLFTASDAAAAFEQILKLNLRGKGDRDVVRVIIECTGLERTYNPYYAQVARLLCKYDHNYKVSFQYALWDMFKEIDQQKAVKLVHSARLTSSLMSNFSLSLSMLKVLDFASLNARVLLYLRTLFTSLILSYHDTNFMAVCKRAAELRDARALKVGLALFLHRWRQGHFGDLSSTMPPGFEATEENVKKIRSLSKKAHRLFDSSAIV